MIINVINTVSLERDLFLTLELMDFGVEVIIILNMWDEAQIKNLKIDTVELASILKGEVLPMVAKTGIGVDKLKNQINDKLRKNVQAEESQTQKTKPYKTRYQKKENNEENIFANRLKLAQKIGKNVLSQPAITTYQSNNSKLDLLTTHPVLGIVSFLVAMYVMFFFAINVSAVFIDFFDMSTGAVLIKGGHQLFDALGFPSWLTVILADGIGGGVQTVATFIPVIGFLYLVLTWLEDSGYMARAAFVMNGLMQKIGLSGQAFVPLIVSFGCNVPAIMATRSLPSRREKLVTIMMAPFMSCGARLSVYALFVAAFFSQYATAIVFALYFIGILIAVLTGVMLQKTILPGKAEPFLIELPPWRIPTFKNLIIGTWRRLKGFLLDAGKIIIIMVMLIQVLNSIGKDFSWGNEDSENSMLSAAAKMVVPVFKPMGIEEKNWPAIVGILTGVLAKEVVVGTLDAIYTSLDKQERKLENKQGDEQDATTIKQELVAAVVSIKDNAIGLGDLILDPLGLSITDAGSDAQMAANQDVSDSLFGIIRDKFSDKYAAFAYLLFILLYFPCVAATAAIAREAGTKWAIFSATWSTGLAYMIATNFYQLSHFSRNPLSASIWLLSFILLITAVYLYLKRVGTRVYSFKLKVL